MHNNHINYLDSILNIRKKLKLLLLMHHICIKFKKIDFLKKSTYFYFNIKIKSFFIELFKKLLL